MKPSHSGSRNLGQHLVYQRFFALDALIHCGKYSVTNLMSPFRNLIYIIEKPEPPQAQVYPSAKPWESRNDGLSGATC